MTIDTLYKKIALLSPYAEVILRKLYWHNVVWLNRFRPQERKTDALATETRPFDFEKIIAFIKENGVKEGSLLLVHSSYDMLKGAGLKPNEIISRLREIIGENGTLAMPVIRRYKDYPQPEEWLKTDFSTVECTYDPKKTPIISGLLPSMLLREKDSVVSLHPLNTLAAVGPLAQQMMEHNIDGDKPTPHGPNSSWKFCADHNAIILALGVNMAHHLTIAHVAEDCFEDWPFQDWYNDLRFNILLPDNTVKKIVVRERKPCWGLFHDAELNQEKELHQAGLIVSTEINGIPISMMHSESLISFMKNHKHKGFPYY